MFSCTIGQFYNTISSEHTRQLMGHVMFLVHLIPFGSAFSAIIHLLVATSSRLLNPILFPSEVVPFLLLYPAWVRLCVHTIIICCFTHLGCFSYLHWLICSIWWAQHFLLIGQLPSRYGGLWPSDCFCCLWHGHRGRLWRDPWMSNGLLKGTCTVALSFHLISIFHFWDSQIDSRLPPRTWVIALWLRDKTIVLQSSSVQLMWECLVWAPLVLTNFPRLPRQTRKNQYAERIMSFFSFLV